MKNKEPRAKSQELRREDQRQRIEGRIIKRVPFAIHLLLLALSFLLLAICGCSGLKEARDIKTAPMPPKYVEAKQKESYAGEGSLWIDKASLYEDLRARRLNDIVTILITETTNASKKATTNDTSTSSLNNAIPNVLGISQLTKRLGNFQQGIQGNANTSFAGEGDTASTTTFTDTISAKVVEVLPNGNLVLESRKERIINNDKEIIVIRGIIRPEDISPTNTISSAQVADAKIYLVGDGVLADKQSQGWLVKA
ncbi:MAG TPA: flagellar basal body L-ring protein FlgH, partial [Dissulfurispiraceae bacterium]|nr:flagellar basal body L-ring protein FlgH [Dissulfurispiraceae bacterium]